ncbi:MAG: VOC family protein [Deltaproteobacteria bacterium]|nr:VOC family protein [Deltaproteobacteria bacterium]
MPRLVKVYRYDPATDIEGEFREYEIPDTPGQSVMDALDYIHQNLDPSLSYYSHSRCAHGICARCAVRVNGENVLACVHPLPDNDVVYISPISKDRVMKDLITKKSAAPVSAGKPTAKAAAKDVAKGLISRPDHFLIFVRDLEKATELWRDLLGFEVQYGGRNEAIGYHNYLIRFGLVYIELLGLIDWKKGLSSGLVKSEFAKYFETGHALALSYCMAADRLEKLAEQVKNGALEDAIGPLPMERTRPDGKTLHWELCLPSGLNTFQRLAWPIFIRWTTPDEERLSWDPPAQHPNKAVDILGISIAVRDIERIRHIYEDDFGLERVGEQDVPDLGARRIRYQVAGFSIDLLTPAGSGIVEDFLRQCGDGPFQIVLAVESLDGAQKAINPEKVTLKPAPEIPGGLLIDHVATFGIRLVFVEKDT